MLPGIDTEEGLKGASNGVLVGSGGNGEGARVLVLDEPSPTRALDTSEGGVCLLLEGIERAKVLLDGS